jgi:hypothetical protein
MSNNLEVQVSDALIRHLERRAARLVLLVETATQASAERGVREGGAQLVERIQEMMEELTDLRAAGDTDVPDLVEGIHRRLFVAQKKVDAWNIPESVRRVLEQRGPETSAKPARRRRPKAA